MHTIEQATINTTTNYEHEQPFGLQADEPVVIALAHPDDEFLIGQAMSDLIELGHPLTVMVATDGAASTKGDQAFVRSGQRRFEAAAALSAYGITLANQRFLGLDDGCLDRERPLAHYAQAMANSLLDRQPGLVLTTGHGFDHKDHRAVHVGAVAASYMFERLTGLSVPVWGLSERPGDETFAVNPRLKLGRLAFHGSQFEIWEPHEAPESSTVIDLHGYRVSEHSRSELAQYDELLQWESYVRSPIPQKPQALDALLASV